MRRAPSGLSFTSLASFKIRRCWDTAERLTVMLRANSPTADGFRAVFSKISRRVASPRAAKAAIAKLPARMREPDDARAEQETSDRIGAAADQGDGDHR